ncbi:MAG: glutamate racemase [bacterium]|nr:glutamate racemase [bacterium]
MSYVKPIGVFDSGLGGLTVVSELVKRLPNENLIYFGDTGRVPYGTRSAETIERYARQDEEFLAAHSVKLIIAACGTVSSVAAHTANDLSVPFIEVVSPAVDKAVSLTKNMKIGVIGTSATVSSGTFERKICEKLPDCAVISNACPLLVPLVENGWINRDDKITKGVLERYLEPMRTAGVDTLILGCTHFPVLKDIIGDIMGEEVNLVNTGEQAAIAAEKYLTQNNLLNTKAANGTHEFYVSDRVESFSKTASILLGRDISDSVKYVDISKIGG